ncbi:MAG: hypothetical protein J2P56_05575 [Verrucomicrobia bacterium]|nr:hypothetical protein [Verrucomicrobiota bacterium]
MIDERALFFNSFSASVTTDKVKNRPLVVLSILLVALMGVPTLAGGRKKKMSTPKSQAPTISGVTGNTITVTHDKATRAFTITRFSEITVNGQKATITDLKPGMTVSVTIGVDPTQASRVVATGVPEGRKKKREK